MNSGERQRGFTYLSALLLVAVVGAGLAILGGIWSQSRQREKEAELIWVGAQFKQAIGAYYERSPGSVKRYPEKLDDLLEDPRYVATQRYLRRIYPDPMTGKTDWVLDLAAPGGVMGVRSRSTATPLRTIGIGTKYSDWEFSYQPPARPVGR